MASPGDSFTVAIPFNVNRIGDVPVSIDIEYGEFKLEHLNLFQDHFHPQLS